MVCAALLLVAAATPVSVSAAGGGAIAAQANATVTILPGERIDTATAGRQREDGQRLQVRRDDAGTLWIEFA